MVDTHMNCLEAIAGFRNDRHRCDFQKPAHPSPDDGVIVS
jgi:hypothetical protein